MSEGATGVRIDGDVVHRRVGPWTADVHELLAHVRANAVPEAPEVLGVDGDEEVVGFIEGDVVMTMSDDGLASVGDLLRRLRAALATFPRPAVDRAWRGVDGGSVLVHGDVAPWNLVFRDDEVAGLLDWDLAGLATPLYDLAYACWTCVPLEPHGGDVATQARRLRVLVDAFGATADERGRLLEEVAFSQARSSWIIARGWSTDDLGLPMIWDEGRRLGGIGRGMAWLAEHRDALTEALTL